MELISVIVPIYKVEPYLAKCVDSILAQTHTNLEIILVDDGSPDRCGAICDEYAATDNRIKVIHKENGGVSSARNAGLDMASGEWVAFVDADDYIDSTMYEEMLSVAQKTQVTVVECNYRRHAVKNNGSGAVYVHTGLEAAEKMFTEDDYPLGFSVSPCTKLINSSATENIRFVQGCGMAEDMVYALELFCRSERAVKFDKRFYTYRINENSATNHSYNLNQATEIEAVDKAMEVAEHWGNERLQLICKRRYLNTLQTHWIRCKRKSAQQEFANKAKQLRKRFLEAYPAIKKSVGRKQRLKSELFRFCPRAYFWIWSRSLGGEENSQK